MKKSVFDSDSEKRLFLRLKTNWNRYVDVFPQIPVRGIVEYKEIKNFEDNPKLTDYLLKTSFDFVVCELNSGVPILVIEFDGLSGGFSKAGVFQMNSKPCTDKYRKLKMEAKLRLCSAFRIPMVAISYEESELLSESEDWISILDVIIGDALEKRNHENNYTKYTNMIGDAYEFGGKESAEIAAIEVDVINEASNPIKRKIRSITENFPFWPYQIVFPTQEGKWISGSFKLSAGIKTEGTTVLRKSLMQVHIRMRMVEAYASDSVFLVNTIGEYCLTRKAENILGADLEKWTSLYENTEWSI